jgi:hypothetical protein
MTTSRPTLARRALGLVAVPALLVGLAACGDDDDSGGDSASGDSASSDFCDQAESLNETFEEVDDPTSEQFTDALDRIRSMDPPEEIADDWNELVSALEGIEDIDLENPDPEALAALETEELEAAGQRVDEYLAEECDIAG